LLIYGNKKYTPIKKGGKNILLIYAPLALKKGKKMY